NWMNANGKTIFLDVSEQILVDRLTPEADHRPILQTGHPIEQIVKEKLATRRKFYEKAHLHLRSDNPEGDFARLIAEQLATLGSN
ncbi:MAG: shikimate kinase, partial [Bacteroidota bacterium]